MISILKQHSILYVEDEPEIQANIAEYLENFFGDIHLASNGEEALDQYKKHSPDVMLLDINLPGLDGIAVAQNIRKNDHNTKIVMLTAFTEKDQLLEATELKLIKYLVKPVSPREFRETLNMLADDLANNPSRFAKIGDHLMWDVEQERLSLNGKSVKLAEKEHRLLKLFIQLKGKPVTYNKIIASVWEDAVDKDISIESVKKQVSQLRKKVPGIDISSIYGEGYVLK